MSRFREDPLLNFARIILTIALAIVAVAGVGLALGIPVMGLFHGFVVEELVADGAPAAAFWGILGLMTLAVVMLALTFFFLRHLRRIVLTVADGDPFVPVNATRLVSMAWLALGVWVVGIPLQAVGSWLEAVTEDGSIQIGVGDDGMSLTLVLTLFVLARVFRMGAAMREDLEGTV